MILAMVLALPVILASAAAPLARDQEQEVAKRALESGQIIPYGQIKNIAQKEFGGRVVGQQLREMSKGRWVYELRILSKDGTVMSVVVDARTGQVLGSRGRR